MKKTVMLLSAMLLILCLCGSAGAEGEYRNIRITVNGEKIILLDENDEQQKSLIVDGNIYVPLEPLISALGGSVVYDEQENLLSIVLNNAAEGEETDPAQAFLGSWNIGPLTTLDIFEDGTGKFQLNGTRYSVTWRLEGQTLQMQQNGKGGVSAVRSGENLEVNIGGQVFLFHR